MFMQYFFSHGDVQFGPYTGRQLQDLATAGKVERTDLVWRQGVGVAIPAARVSHLFDEQPAALPEAGSEPVDAPTQEPAQEPAQSVPPATVAAPPKSAPPIKERPRRVNSIKGGVLIGQDGRQVQFRKKCSTCGTEDQSRTTALIRPGSMKIPYYCRKCRKGRCVEMVGIG